MLLLGCHAHGFAWAWKNLGGALGSWLSHAHAKPWAWHPARVANMDWSRYAYCARNVRRNAMTWVFCSCRSCAKLAAEEAAWPACISMACSSVVARPSCRYGAESATPHKGGVRHSSGNGPSEVGAVMSGGGGAP